MTKGAWGGSIFTLCQLIHVNWYKSLRSDLSHREVCSVLWVTSWFSVPALWSDVLLSLQISAFSSLYPSSLPCHYLSLFILFGKSFCLFPGPYPSFGIARVLLMASCPSQGPVSQNFAFIVDISLHLAERSISNINSVKRTGANYNTNWLVSSLFPDSFSGCTSLFFASSFSSISIACTTAGASVLRSNL